MEVTSTTTTSADSTLSSATESMLEMDEFLTLFVTQLQYQDPLAPMDSMDFTSQLADFSSLEQLYNLNESAELTNEYQNSLNNLEAINMIGKSVTLEGDDESHVITGVTFEDGITYLTLDNGENVMMSDVRELFDTPVEG